MNCNVDETRMKRLVPTIYFCEKAFRLRTNGDSVLENLKPRITVLMISIILKYYGSA